MGAGTWGCGAAPGVPDNQDALTDNVNPDGDTTPDGGSPANGVAPNNDPSVSDLKNSFVLSVPLTGESLAGDAAGQMTAMAAALTSFGWGSGNTSFDVNGMDWLPAVRNVLTAAAARGGLIRTCYLPLTGTGVSPIIGNLADLPPAGSMATVGVLPIVFMTTDFEGYPASGVGLEVELWSQQTLCSTCAYEPSTRYHQQITPLISSTEVRLLRESGLWNDRLIVIIPKAGVWWAQSETSPNRVRNWMLIKPTGGEAGQVRCLTSNGEWPE